jgi:hypothetical protein
VQARGDRARLGLADPDRQAAGAVALLEQDDVQLAGVADVGDPHGDGGGHGGELPSEVGEAGLQRGASLVQAGLDGAHGDPEARRDLGVREVGDVEEGDGVALAGRERGDGGEDAAAQEGVGALPDDLLRARQGGRAGLAARQVAPDPAQPGAEGVVVAEPVESAQRDQQRVLGRVGRTAAGAQQRGAVALGQGGEGVAVADAGGGHELGVGQAGGHVFSVPPAYPRVTHAAIMDCR